MQNHELVILKDKQAVTTSLQVAESFEKRHDHVLRDIENLEKDVPNFGEMFQETNIPDSYNRERKAYLINRDGFTLLAMGFTGKKALGFKIKYIDAFNKMEAKIASSVPTNMVEALTLALEQAKTIEVQNQVIGELKPKADYVDRILKSKSLVTIGQIAKDYGMSAQALNKKLHDLGVQYKQSDQWLLYSKHHSKGYTFSETFPIEDTQGYEKVVMHTKWTQKGRLFLYELLKENDLVPMIERD